MNVRSRQSMASASMVILPLILSIFGHGAAQDELQTTNSVGTTARGSTDQLSEAPAGQRVGFELISIGKGNGTRDSSSADTDFRDNLLYSNSGYGDTVTEHRIQTSQSMGGKSAMDPGSPLLPVKRTETNTNSEELNALRIPSETSKQTSRKHLLNAGKLLAILAKTLHNNSSILFKKGRKNGNSSLLTISSDIPSPKPAPVEQKPSGDAFPRAIGAGSTPSQHADIVDGHNLELSGVYGETPSVNSGTTFREHGNEFQANLLLQNSLMPNVVDIKENAAFPKGLLPLLTSKRSSPFNNGRMVGRNSSTAFKTRKKARQLTRLVSLSPMMFFYQPSPPQVRQFDGAMLGKNLHQRVFKRSHKAPVFEVAKSLHKRRRFDVPQVECPPTSDGAERFSCPSPDRMGRYKCILDHGMCDGFIDCPNAEDEDRMSCMFYQTTKAHLDVLADALLRWARRRY